MSVMDDPNAKWFTLCTVDIDLNRAGVAGAMTPFPPDMLLMIGQCVTVWNDFENLFNEYLTLLVSANGSDSTNLGRLRGKRLRKRFVDETATQFPKSPEIKTFANRIRIDANRASKTRNALVHGRLEYQVTITPDGPQSEHIKAYSNDGVFNFDRAKLDTLRHDLVGLAGRIELMLRPIDAGSWLPSADRLRLLDFVGGNPLNQAILAKLQLPLQP